MQDIYCNVCVVDFFSPVRFLFLKRNLALPHNMSRTVRFSHGSSHAPHTKDRRQDQHPSRLPLSYKSSFLNTILNSTLQVPWHLALQPMSLSFIDIHYLVPPHPLRIVVPRCTWFNVFISHDNSWPPRELQSHSTLNVLNKVISSF